MRPLPSSLPLVRKYDGGWAWDQKQLLEAMYPEPTVDELRAGDQPPRPGGMTYTHTKAPPATAR